MNTRVVVVPCLPVAQAHLREATRTLVAHGFPRDGLDDDHVGRLLWLARALPVAIDVVADLDLPDRRFPHATVEVQQRPPARGPLHLLGWRRDDEPFVELLVLSPEALAARLFGEAFIRIVVDLETVAPAPFDPAEEPTLESVRLQRFSFG
jgi:hypothetical protein